MKDLSTYIIESFNDRHICTIEWLEEHYNKFNRDYFNNELPDHIVLKCQKEPKNDALAYQYFEHPYYISSEYMDNDMYIMFYKSTGRKSIVKGRKVLYYDIIDNTSKVEDIMILSPMIVFNTKYRMDDDQMCDTLLHEMCHLWVSRNGLNPKRAHGKEFKHKAKEITRIAKTKFNKDYELSTYAKSNTYEQDLDDIQQDLQKSIYKNTLSIYIKYNDGILKYPISDKERMLFCTKRSLRKILNSIDQFGGEYIDKIYISNTAYKNICSKYGDYSRQTTFRYWNVATRKNPEDIRQILMKDATMYNNVNEIQESIFEKKNVSKKDMIEISGNTRDIDVEDIINITDDILDGSSSRNDKQLISGEIM